MWTTRDKLSNAVGPCLIDWVYAHQMMLDGLVLVPDLGRDYQGLSRPLQVAVHVLGRRSPLRMIPKSSPLVAA